MGIRKLLLLSILSMSAFLAGAQDIIHQKDGEEIKAVVIDVSPGVIKYKKFEMRNGPVYSIARDQVVKITYQNGKIVDFTEEVESEIPVEDISDEVISPSSTFGWHIGIGASTIESELLRNKWQLASTIGADYSISVGSISSIMIGMEILSIGSGIDDYSMILITDQQDTIYDEISNWVKDMGYINLEIMYRQFINRGRNYFVSLGMYGSFLMNVQQEGDVISTFPDGAVLNWSFHDDLSSHYVDFDYGITMGLGGRIPLGESKKWHITLEGRFYYGLQNILDYKNLQLSEYKENNLFGFFLMGVDIPTKSSD